MKLVNRFFVLFLTAALIVFAPLAGSITASAAEPKVFQVKYIPELGEWRTQCLPSWDDNRENGNLDFVLYNAVDGDSVVIHATNEAGLEIKFTQQALGNLTVMGDNSDQCVIVHSEKPIKVFYAILGAVASMNCEIEDAYIFDNATCNLNKNVKNVYISGESKMEMNVAALGTVEKCVITNTNGSSTTMYNVRENALRVEKGENKTDPQKYSTNSASAPAAPSTPAATPAPSADSNASTTTTPAATAAPSTSTAATHSPATGGDSNSLLLLAGVLACLAIGCTFMKRKA